MELPKVYDTDGLLDDKRVVAEIERHLWIESEKVGHDIGYDKAKEDWLKKFSKAWMDYHMPNKVTKIPNTASTKSSRKKTHTSKDAPAPAASTTKVRSINSSRSK